MKKIISILLVLIVLCGCTMMSSYGTEYDPEFELEPYTVYFNQKYESWWMSTESWPDGADLTNVSVFPDDYWWYGVRIEYEDPDAPKTFTANIFGKEYTLEYHCSEKAAPLSAEQAKTFHVYGDPDGAMIRINALTQQVIAWHDYDLLDAAKSLGNALEFESPEFYAKEEEYGRIWLEQLIGKELADQYVYVAGEEKMFRRYVDGFTDIVPEHAYVRCCVDGSVYSYTLVNTGYYDDVAATVFDEEKAEKAITEAIQKLYPGGAEYVSGTREVQITINGRLVYRYSATVQTAEYGRRNVHFVIAGE